LIYPDIARQWQASLTEIGTDRSQAIRLPV